MYVHIISTSTCYDYVKSTHAYSSLWEIKFYTHMKELIKLDIDQVLYILIFILDIVCSPHANVPLGEHVGPRTMFNFNWGLSF
jgi:hypothetical protein